ncbi:MAG: nuclear transport factor 2 family protein [Acidobacteria bacterium]|nr:nuclear transport factor 2 family protein [Acidobacteriota bacterium]
MTPEDLVEIELIKRLKYKYLRCLDQKLFEGVGECFTEHATAAYSGGVYSFEGRQAIVAFLVESMGSEKFLSSHRCHHPEIDLVSDTEATGTWALEDVVIEETFDITIRGAAFYEDRYVKLDGVWLIAHTGYLRSYEEIHPRGSIEGLTVTASWWGTNGKSSLGGTPQ